jgi:putative transposase
VDDMSKVRFIENLDIQPEDLEYSKWPTIHLEHRDETFNKRKRAVEMYLDNTYSLEEIKNQTGIDRKELNKLVRKCISRDSKGSLWGFRALLSYRRLGVTYDRVTSVDGMKQDNFTGAFTQLLERYPKIQELIDDHILKRRKRAAADKVILMTNLNEKLLKLCRSLGVELNEYPFNTKDKALRSLQRYVSQLINENIVETRHRFGENAARKIKRLTGQMSDKDLETIPFKAVQFDGHKIDALLTVTFKNAYGDEVTEVMKRIWLLLIIDEATRVVLGYHLCVNSEYSQLDVLHCIRKAIMPWQPMEFTIPGLRYPDAACFHSMIPEAEWAVWNEMKYDHGKPNLANVVKDRLTSIVNCSVNPGPVAFPEARSIIERFFGVLTQRQIQRLAITTGSNSKDPRRQKPEKAAKKFKVTAEELEQLMEVLIAEYNTEVHSAFGISPIEAMTQLIQFQEMYPRLLEEDKRSDANFFSYSTTRVIRGSKENGKRPHINFEGAEYTSNLMAQNFSLVGATIKLIVNIDDVSVVRTFMPDGSELDFLRARGAWGKKPHSLRTRRVINKLVRDGKLRFSEDESAVDSFARYLEGKAEKDKSARNELASQKRYEQSHIGRSSDSFEGEEVVGYGNKEDALPSPLKSKKSKFDKLQHILKTSI